MSCSAAGGVTNADPDAGSYYEFTAPPGQRLTDQAWRARLDGAASNRPARPDWQKVLLPQP